MPSKLSPGFVSSAAISLRQGPEGAAVEGEGGQVFPLCSNPSLAGELCSGNLRHQEGTAGTGGMLPLALPGMGSVPLWDPREWLSQQSHRWPLRVSEHSSPLCSLSPANCCGHVVFRKTETLPSEHETFTCSRTNQSDEGLILKARSSKPLI